MGGGTGKGDNRKPRMASPSVGCDVKLWFMVQYHLRVINSFYSEMTR